MQKVIFIVQQVVTIEGVFVSSDHAKRELAEIISASDKFKQPFGVNVVQTNIDVQ